MNINTIHLAETDSTNSYIKSLNDTGGADDMLVVVADYQTAGRGQGTNTWHSSPGQNLLFSMAVHPTMVPVGRQFLLSMTEALALQQALSALTDGISMKWPNDIYWHDRKLSGTLIETTLGGGHIRQCVFGTGVNVNEPSFPAELPNPVSLRQILGHDTDRKELLSLIISKFEGLWQLLTEGGYGDIFAMYHAALYRAHGYHRFRDKDGEFEAAIVEVEDDGHLVVHDRNGVMRRYAFKEIEFVI